MSCERSGDLMQQKALEQLGVIAGTTEAARTGP